MCLPRYLLLSHLINSAGRTENIGNHRGRGREGNRELVLASPEGY